MLPDGGSLGPSCHENLTATVASIPLAPSGSGGSSWSFGAEAGWAVRMTSGDSPGPRMGHAAVQTGGGSVPGHMVVVAGQTDNYCRQSG